MRVWWISASAITEEGLGPYRLLAWSSSSSQTCKGKSFLKNQGL